jgi:hypothetical protein
MSGPAGGYGNRQAGWQGTMGAPAVDYGQKPVGEGWVPKYEMTWGNLLKLGYSLVGHMALPGAVGLMAMPLAEQFGWGYENRLPGYAMGGGNPENDHGPKAGAGLGGGGTNPHAPPPPEPEEEDPATEEELLAKKRRNSLYGGGFNKKGSLLTGTTRPSYPI